MRLNFWKSEKLISQDIFEEKVGIRGLTDVCLSPFDSVMPAAFPKS